MDDEQQIEVAARIGDLLYKFVSDDITDDERTEMYNWVYSSKENQELFEEVVYSEKFQESIRDTARIDVAAALRSVQARIISMEKDNVVQMPPNRRRYSIALAVAASLGLLIITFGYFYFRKDNTPVRTITVSPVAPKNDLLPGSSKATLILGNGQVIALETNLEKNLGVQGAADIKELLGGKLNYTMNGAVSKGNENAFNTLVTPKAGQFQLVLSDGTKVWLNNASSLKYPASFVGSTREVQLEGEAYFEVAHNSSSPFLVKSGNMTIRDIGTSFNVKAYADERLAKVTLIEGGVRVGDLTLKPGQQAITEGNVIELSKKPNIEQALAWKNGYFQFDRTDIQEVMRELSRWYDVDKVVYEGKQTNRSFSGTIPRDYDASDVLKLLEMVDIHFRIEGKTIVVTE
jgi:transmembrane sensor